MKTITFLLFLAAFCPTQEEAVTLNIAFENINKNYLGKTMYVGYWMDDSGNFPTDNQPDVKQKLVIDSYTPTIQKQLKQGEYAISIFIDINGNRKLDKNFVGAPTEPYCFSQNYKPTFSSPNFEDCSILLQEEKTIKLKFIH